MTGERVSAFRRGLLFAISLLVPGCSPETGPRLNVLLVSIDTLRPDRLGCYGATRIQTPAIDALARTGVRFENAFTPAPLTLPAHWTIMTGVEPWRHAVIDNGMTLAEPKVATLAERFFAAGYDTATFVSAFVLHRTFGLAQDSPGTTTGRRQMRRSISCCMRRAGPTSVSTKRSPGCVGSARSRSSSGSISSIRTRPMTLRKVFERAMRVAPTTARSLS